MSTHFPEVIKQVAIENGVELTLKINKDTIYFNGHFEDFSVLPGVAQVHWAIELSKRYLKPLGAFAGFDTVKFTSIIQPDDVVHLRLIAQPHETVLRFEYFDETRTKSNGKINFIKEKSNEV